MKKINEFFYSFPRIIIVNIFKIIIRIRVFNYERIPVNRQVIFAINHVTGADPILILAGLKKKLVFLAISDDFKTKFTNFFFRKVGNAVPVFQKDLYKNFSSFKEIFENLKTKKVSLAIFPEGKLNKTDVYDDFKKGTAYFAYKSKLSIIPIYIQGVRGLKAGTRAENNKVSEGISALAINLFRRINIFVGNPIDPIAENIISDFKNPDTNKNYREIVDDIHEQLEEDFWELQYEAKEILGK
ncbi:MAG: lysophospholipid acyltransferase family protein [Actinomycetota bacterium]|nr:lysophospholipid acyltransferase family protein [Actinomycetota bacterium]